MDEREQVADAMRAWSKALSAFRDVRPSSFSGAREAAGSRLREASLSLATAIAVHDGTSIREVYDLRAVLSGLDSKRSPWWKDAERVDDALRRAEAAVDEWAVLAVAEFQRKAAGKHRGTHGGKRTEQKEKRRADLKAWADSEEWSKLKREGRMLRYMHSQFKERWHVCSWTTFRDDLKSLGIEWVEGESG